MSFGDPDELDRTAVRLEADAQRLRDAAAAAVTAAEAAHWVSASAQRFREVVAQDGVRANAIADDLGRAAQLLRAHSDQVRDTQARLGRLEKSAVEWFHRHVAEARVSPAQESIVPGLAGRLRAAAEAGDLTARHASAP
jgi:hypothetical protein